MTTRRVEYRGKTITVRSSRHALGWAWSYQIGAGPLHEFRDRLLDDEEVALAEALASAKHEIDRHVL
jgi:hypothetical protein